MCTAISNNNFFGRTLDIDRSYGEEVCVMPRKFPLIFKKAEEIKSHYAIIGMATVVDGIPLFYDATNEYGLSMAGLNFPKNAHYKWPDADRDNITPFEIIPWILGQCKTVEQAKDLLDNVNIIDTYFNEFIPNSPLHWLVADRDGSIVIESREQGLFVHHNPVNVLTNNPPFEYQLENLKRYEHLRPDNSCVLPENNQNYVAYSQGLGAVGLPGDLSSMSRFVRATFNLQNSAENTPSQFFHILSSVEMIKGACITDNGTLDYTLYTSCVDTEKGLYYYKTYDDFKINCVDMHQTDLDSNKISRYKL